MLAIATAGRKSAILELTWDRVDFERGLIYLGKGERRLKGRATVPMTESLRVELVKAREVSLSEYVVEHGARQIKEIGKGFRQAAKRANLKVTPHDLRRSAAIWMAEDGVPMSEIAAYLGHKNSRITEEVYAKYSPDYLRKASKSLEI
jgi:integrase